MTARVTTESDDTDTGSEAEPSLDGLFEQMLGGGANQPSTWDQLDQGHLGKLLSKQLHDQRQRLRRDALKFRECFVNNPAGREVLQILLNQTLRVTAYPFNVITDAKMLMAFGMWREGQNQLVAGIIEAIAMADNKDMQPRSDT
jgi:hypothetical protein